jgi:hypothetical protein
MMTHRTGIALLTRLALLAVAAVLIAFPRVVKPADANSDDTEIRNYRLTMDKIQKAANATEAIGKLLAANPTLKKQMDEENGNSQTIDQSVKFLDTKCPQCSEVIKSNGLTTHEYIVVSFAFIRDTMMVGMKKEGMIKDYPPNSITPENATFIEQNFDKLKDLAVKMAPAPNSTPNSK